jgi:hypothetical protein
MQVIALCLLFGTGQGSISLTAQVESNEIVLINNGLVQSPFADLLNAKSNIFLHVEDQPVTFSLTTDQDYSYSLTTVPLAVDSSSFEMSLASDGFIAAGSVTNFTLSFNCTTNSFPIFVWFWEVKGAGGFEQFSVHWMKECRVQSCSAECSLHGTCNQVRGECNCDAEWFGEACNINFNISKYGPYCGNESITASWSIPESLATNTDWIALYSDYYLDTLADNVAEWYYLNNPTKIAGRQPNPVGSVSFSFWRPGNYTLFLFAEDGYEVLASYQIQVLDWAQCLPENWDCERDCKSGTCDESGICNCEVGFFSYDCSLGCNGTVTLTESSGIFDNGWGNRNYGFAFDAENPLIPVQCNWVVSPSIALDQIESSKRKVLGVFLKLNFLTFDVARSNPISVYEGDTPTVTELTSLSGQILPPSISVNSTSVFLTFSPNNLGFRGFRISYSVDIIDAAIFEDILIDFNHPAGLGIAIVTLVLGALALAIGILLLARRDHFIVRASSLLFCMVIVLGVLFGYGTVFTFLVVPTVISCTFRLWLASIGFVLVFGCLFFKNFRIYKIFSNKKLRKFKMTDVAVLKLLGLLLLFEIVLLVLWTVFDLPEVVLQQNLQDQTQATVCRWNQIAFVAVSLFAKAVLMGFGVYLSIKTRKAITFYRESKFVGISIYSFFVTATIFISILYVISDFYVVWWILITLGIIMIFTITLFVIFGRIVYYIFKFPANSAPEALMKQQRSTRPASMIVSPSAINADSLQ